MNPSKLSGTKQLLELWMHEFQRVFEDRLVSSEDKDLMNMQLFMEAQKISMSEEI